MRRLLLAFGGKPHSGKTISAEHIASIFASVKVYNISEVIAAELGLVRSEVKDVRILQEHGNRRRKEDPDYWVRRLFSAINLGEEEISIFPNLRMPNEARSVKAYGGYNIRFTRLNDDGSQYVAGDRDMNDPLETSLDSYNWDFHIVSKFPDLAKLQAATLTEYLLRRTIQ